jgi:hypothetical protein
MLFTKGKGKSLGFLGCVVPVVVCKFLRAEPGPSPLH